MAPTSNDSSSKTQSVLHFARYLQHALKQDIDAVPALATHLQALTSSSSPLHDAIHEERLQLHQTGVDLWNECRHEDNDDSAKHNALRTQVRAFAYLILTKPTETTSIRAARACINGEQYSLASSILERISQSSSNRYALLRILLAWKQDQPAIAELFFARISNLEAEDASEDAMGLFYEMGAEYLDREQHEEGKKWLERAHNVLQDHDWRSKFDGPELRLNVIHAYTRCLFKLDGHYEAARGMLATLHAEYPYRLAVSLLSMEHSADAKELYTILASTIQSMQLMPSNFELVMHYIHVLCKSNVEYACKALGNFVVKRLVPEDMSAWIEISVLTTIRMLTQHHDTYCTPENLKEALGLLWQAGKAPILSLEASQGAVVLIWKRIEQAFETNVQGAIEWCKIALMLAGHPEGSSVQYKEKLNRKLVACHVAVGEYAAARDVLERLSDNANAHHLTSYWAYVVAMRSNDETMAERALSSVASAPKDVDKLLFACVHETQKFGSPVLQAKVLQRILDKYSNQPHPDINISTLLRATARLLWQGLGQEKDDVDEEVLERLCAVFKAAKNYSIRCNGDKQVAGQSFGVIDCEWFSKNGYNLVLQMVQQWPNRHSLRILENIAYLKYPEPLPGDIEQQRVERSNKIAYVRIILHATEARNGDEAAHTKIMDVYNQNFVRGEPDQMFHRLLPIVFKAAIHSKVEGQPGTLFRLVTWRSPQSPKTYAECADLILTAAMASDETHLRIDTAVALLNGIISQIRTLQGYDIKQASRWIRCVVQLIIDTSTKIADEEGADARLRMLKNVLDEAAQIVHDASYPSEELGWLATTAFNLAVDLYVVEKDDAGRQMASKALIFADAMAAEKLANLLREKMRKIGWCPDDQILE